jgi:hypothetical protein
MRGKKGMEISINVIVMIILGMIMFMAAIAIFTTLFKETMDIGDQVDERMRANLLQRFPSNELVFLPETSKAPQRRIFSTDKHVTFYVGIYNDQDTRTAYKLDLKGTDSSGIKDDNLLYLSGEFSIEPGQREIYFFIVNIEGLESGKQHGVIVHVTRQEVNEWVQHGLPRIAYVDLR